MSSKKRDDNSKSYTVGYGRPPRETQFQKGQSGNPKGRPKGSKNRATIITRELNKKVTIVENGRRRTVTKYEMAVIQQANKAAAGDRHAYRIIIEDLAREERAADGQQAEADPAARRERDALVMKILKERFGPDAERGDDDGEA